MEELSAKTVQQYAALVSKIARDRALPITRGRSAWGRVRAALLWAVNFNRGNRSREHNAAIDASIDRLLKDKTPRVFERGGYASKKDSAARLVENAVRNAPTKSWRSQFWPHVTGKHKAAIACMITVPLRPIDVSLGVKVRVIRQNMKSPWAQQAIASGSPIPSTIEFICDAGKRDQVIYFNRGTEPGMVKPGYHKGQEWRKIVYRLNDSPWLQYLAGFDGQRIDLGAMQEPRSISSAIKKAANRAALGSDITATTLKHVILGEFKAFVERGDMESDDVSKSASHSSSETTIIYGRSSTGKLSLSASKDLQPPVVEAAQDVRKTAASYLERFDRYQRNKSKKSSKRLLGPLEVDSKPKPKGG